MIALDTNILVYSRRQESLHHVPARKLVGELATGTDPWAIPWPCVYEFLRVVTHPRVFDPPTPLETVLEDLDSLFGAPSLSMLGEGPAHPSHLVRLVSAGRATGNLVHDAHIAALLMEHGVRELLTTDRDFSRFPDLRIRNPFQGDEVHESRVRYRTPAVSRRAKRTSRARAVRR